MPVLENARHERFAQLIASGWGVLKAYAEAGYEANDSNASRLHGDERVKARVAELLETQAYAARLTRDWIKQKTMQLVERCMQAEPVTDREGNPTGEYIFQASGANQALRLLNDMLPPEKSESQGVVPGGNVTDINTAREEMRKRKGAG